MRSTGKKVHTRSDAFGRGLSCGGGSSAPAAPREHFGDLRRILLMACTATLLAGPAAGSGQPAAPTGPGTPPLSPLSSLLSLAPLPDIETFMQIGAVGRPVLSPDGQDLFVASSTTGVSQIYRVLPGGWPYQLTFFPEGVDASSFNRDCTFAILGVDTGGNEQYQMVLMDTHTGAVRPLTSDPGIRYSGPVWSLDGLHLYYGANTPDPASFHVYEMDLRGGRPRPLVQMTGSNGVIDVSPDGTKLIVYNTTSSLDNNLYLYDLGTGSLDLLTPHTGDHSYGGGVFSSDGRSAYVTSDNNPDGIIRLARLDLATKMMEPIFADDPRWDVETFNISDNRRFLCWVLNEDGYSKLHLYDLEKRSALPVPSLAGIVSSPAPTDAGFLAFTFNNPTRTPDVWIWDYREAAGLETHSPWRGAAGNPVQVTFSSYAGIDPETFHDPILVHYSSFDGTEIPAFLYLPPGYRGQPVPFIIEAHGGPTGQFRPFFNRHFQYLMQHGFGLFAPNFRGSTGYGREFEDADNYRRRFDSIKDVAAGAHWLIDQGYARKGQIGIKGASYGGYVTLAAMTEFPDLFAAGVDQVGIANFQTFLEKTADYRRSLRESEYGPLSDLEFLHSISPLYKADRIRGALMVVHGENDPRVPVGEARQILRAVREHGTPVDSLIFPDEGHGIGKKPNQLVFYRRMVEFFERHLTPGSPARGSN